MTVNLFDLADRANIAFSNLEGFSGCIVEQQTPLILAYQFNTMLQAEQFKLTQSTAAPHFTHKIPPDRLTVVLEFR